MIVDRQDKTLSAAGAIIAASHTVYACQNFLSKKFQSYREKRNVNRSETKTTGAVASSRQAGGTEQGVETADRNRSEDGSRGVRGKEEAAGGNKGTGEVGKGKARFQS